MTRMQGRGSLRTCSANEEAPDLASFDKSSNINDFAKLLVTLLKTTLRQVKMMRVDALINIHNGRKGWMGHKSRVRMETMTKNPATTRVAAVIMKGV